MQREQNPWSNFRCMQRSFCPATQGHHANSTRQSQRRHAFTSTSCLTLCWLEGRAQSFFRVTTPATATRRATNTERALPGENARQPALPSLFNPSSILIPLFTNLSEGGGSQKPWSTGSAEVSVPVCLERHPTSPTPHSGSKHGKLVLDSQQCHSVQLVRDAMERNAVIVLFTQGRGWLAAVEGLKKYARYQ